MEISSLLYLGVKTENVDGGGMNTVEKGDPEGISSINI